MKVYISGKISGLTEKEYRHNFYCALVELTKIIHISCPRIINPINIKPLFGIKRWLFYMIADLWQLRKCTHICMLSNWTDSKGAWVEYGYAKFILKIPVIFL